MSVTSRSTAPALAGVDWRSLAPIAAKQQKNRENSAPTVSVYRWWARRSHAVIGAILDAVAEPGDVVSDPFSGGGTVAVEGARRGLTVVAQDLHPWAAQGLRTVFDQCPPERIAAAGQRLTEELAPLREKLYTTPCPHHGSGETVNAFWVRVLPCRSCGDEVYLYPYGLLTLASRSGDETHGYFGCSACGKTTRSALATSERRCRACRRRLPGPDDQLLPKRVAWCRGCRSKVPAFDGRGGRWQLALLQRACRVDGRGALHFDYPTPADVAAANAGAGVASVALSDAIPDGVETTVLTRAGFRRWSDLYPSRQLTALLGVIDAVHRLDVDEAARTRLLVATCGAAEMAGRLSRWDRYYPKAFEAVANHRYNTVGFACEVNPLADRGRGTIPRRIAASVKAARWTQQQRSTTPLGPVFVACGSSDRQPIRAGAVDVVVTDPPYFDDVQYAELGDLFLVWARAARLLPLETRTAVEHEAVVNTVRGTGLLEYQQRLAAIFTEAVRTLRPDGTVILTFHNSDLRAWFGLSAALGHAGLHVLALAVTHAENTTDHAKRARRAFSKDLVIECVSGPVESVHVLTPASDDQDRDLLAAGLVLAEGHGDLVAFRADFTRRRRKPCYIRSDRSARADLESA